MNGEQDDAKDHLATGDLLLVQGKFSEAADAYCMATERDPGLTEANWKLGLSLANLGKHNEAIEQYRKATELKPDYVLAHHNCGLALASLGKYAEAVEQYRKATELKPDFALAYHNWCLALANQRKYPEAIEQFRKATDVDPKYVDPFLDWGNALGEQGRYEEAIEVCRKAIQARQDFAFAYHNIAYFLGVQGRYDEAREAWDDALQAYQRAEEEHRATRSADFFSYFGGVVNDIFGDLDRAERILKEGLSIAPEHERILINLGTLYKGRHDEPVREGEKPGEKTAAYWTARDYLRRAERVLKGRLERSEEYPSLLLLGNLYLEMQEYDEAKKYLEKARDKDGEAAAPHSSLGVVCSRREKYRQAGQHFEDAHRRDPHDLTIWSNLAEVYHKLKLTEKAEAEFRKILKITDDHIDSQIGLGEVYTAMGDGGDTESYESAIRHYTRAIDLGRSQRGSKRLRTRDLAALFHSRGYARIKLYEASRLLADESQLDEALKDFDQCYNLDPGHSKADRARTKIRQRLRRFTRHWFTEKVGPWLVLVPSLLVLGLTQSSFFFGRPALLKPIGVASYIALTFGALIFVVVGLFLPQIQKLKGAGIEIEKISVTQISTSGTFGITK